MSNFFNNLLGGGKDDDKKKKKPNNNPFANMTLPGQGPRKFSGAGQSLGGSGPGNLIHVELKNPGTLGLKVRSIYSYLCYVFVGWIWVVRFEMHLKYTLIHSFVHPFIYWNYPLAQIEKRPNGGGTSIVSMVVEGSQAADAGLQRGDILCYADSDGKSEIMYDDFLALANSGQRPVVFDVRRIEIKTGKKAGGSNTTTTNNSSKSKPQSADAFARKQAVIAAAEARDKAHKAKQKPISKSDKKLPVILSTADKRKQDLERERDVQLQKQEAPRSEQARMAMEAAKKGEADLANQLGYNPYETNKSTAGQARNATVAVQHGAVGSGGSSSNSGSGAPSSPQRIPTVAPPTDPTSAAVENDNHNNHESDAMILSEHPVFEEAYTAMVTTNSNEAVIKAFGIMRTLVKNATTKGQSVEDEEKAAKFRRVRLTNAKIKAAIVDLQGALEVMMSFGFQLTEEDGESYLVYPLGSTGPPFLPAALRQMERYEKS